MPFWQSPALVEIVQVFSFTASTTATISSILCWEDVILFFLFCVLRGGFPVVKSTKKKKKSKSEVV